MMPLQASRQPPTPRLTALLPKLLWRPPARLASLALILAAAGCSRGEPPRCSPTQPVVVLKADDLVDYQAAGISSRWRRFLDHVTANPDLRVDVGVITSSLSTGSEPYRRQVGELGDHPQVQLFHHGWTHRLYRDEAGVLVGCEFSVIPFDEQLEHLEAGLTAARDLGVELEGFGAPCNRFSAETGRALEEAGPAGTWYFGPTDDPRSLLRVGVEFEASPGNPDLPGLKARFDPHATVPQVLQVHPAGWDDEEWPVAVEALGWLLDQGACFVNAREL